MPYKSKTFDEEPVTRSRRALPWDGRGGVDEWPQKSRGAAASPLERFDEEASSSAPDSSKEEARTSVKRWPELKRGHALSFAGILLFTAITYFRPYELIPALSSLTSMAFWAAVATLLVFVPVQLSLEGTPTARPREVNLVLLLLLTGLLSVPFAIEPGEAWPAFIDFTKVVTMFIVMVNVVRSEMRLRAMFWLALIVAIVLSVSALIDYGTGNLALEGIRIKGLISSLFDNPNDMALYLVTMIPLSLGLMFVARGLSKKIVYALCALLLVGAVVVTFSRGGFLGLACAMFVMSWKLGRRNRTGVLLLFLAAIAVFFALVPHDYIVRLLTIFGGSDWQGGSASARENLLLRSLQVMLRHPLFGIGMNNFHNVSAHEQVSHNAYTQVGGEMGVAALVLYVMFLWSAFKRMSAIERETYEERRETRVYYLAVALEAALVGYMVSSFFASVAYLWYIYYLVGYALCLDRLYDAKGASGIFSRVRVGRRLSDTEESNNPVSFQEPLAANGRKPL